MSEEYRMNTSPVSANAFLASLPGSTTSSSSSGASGLAGIGSVDTFYKLLVTQLTNQDPLNPLSNQDLSAQMAQFSVASGVQQMQSSMSSMLQQLAQTQGLQAASLVGKSVALSGNQLTLNHGAASGGFTLAAPAQDAQVLVQDSTGQAVASMDLGPMNAGTQTFSWNGQDALGQALPPGNYRFSVQAVDGSGQPVAAIPFSIGQVGAVNLGSGGPTLQIQGNPASVPLSSVQALI